MQSRRIAPTPGTPGHPEGAHWEAATWDDGDHVHVVPVGDGVPHAEDETGDCICGPTVEPVFRDDGSNGWLTTHHSLDGRERHEGLHDLGDD